MSKSYSKEKSAFKPNVKVSQAKKPKPIKQVSEKKKSELENRKTWTIDQFKKASKEIKKDKKSAFEKPKKTPVSEIKNDLDVIYSCVVRMEPSDSEGFTFCVTCQKNDHWSKLQNGHFIKRSIAPSLVFDRDNCRPQCLRCNVLLEGNRLHYNRYMESLFGKDAIWLMELRGNTKSHMGAFEYQIMLQDYIEKFLVQCTRLNHTPTKIQQKIVDKWTHK